MLVDIFDDPVWQMSWGERAAVEGILSALRPALAVEIGSMEGACLRRIAAHAEEVHSFDLHPPALEQSANVTLHTGDSHELLPRFLAKLTDQGRNIDFAMVDGDHSPEGVRQDLEDLLNSPAVGRTAILIHDTANERVRTGVDAVRFGAWPKVSYVHLDWVPGQLFAEPGLRNELWYGLGLVLVDAASTGYSGAPVYEPRYRPLGGPFAALRESVIADEQKPPLEGDERLAVLRAWLGEMRADVERGRLREGDLATELRDVDAERRREAERLESSLAQMTADWEGAERALDNIKGSASWKLTRPLRGILSAARRLTPQR